MLERHGIEPEALVAEYGPDVDLPPSALEMSEYEAARERGEDVTPRREVVVAASDNPLAGTQLPIDGASPVHD